MENYQSRIVQPTRKIIKVCITGLPGLTFWLTFFIDSSKSIFGNFKFFVWEALWTLAKIPNNFLVCLKRSGDVWWKKQKSKTSLDCPFMQICIIVKVLLSGESQRETAGKEKVVCFGDISCRRCQLPAIFEGPLSSQNSCIEQGM